MKKVVIGSTRLQTHLHGTGTGVSHFQGEIRSGHQRQEAAGNLKNGGDDYLLRTLRVVGKYICMCMHIIIVSYKLLQITVIIAHFFQQSPGTLRLPGGSRRVLAVSVHVHFQIFIISVFFSRYERHLGQCGCIFCLRKGFLRSKCSFFPLRGQMYGHRGLSPTTIFLV